MESVPWQTVYAAVEIIGEGEHGRIDAEVERRIRVLVNDDLTLHRLTGMIPEAFGLVLAAHLPEAATMTLPTTFSVQDAAGQWQPVPIKNDPIFVEAIEIAQHIFHNGPRHLFKNNSELSAIFDLINNSLNKGGPKALQDSKIASLCINDLPASLYDAEQTPRAE